jgi:hypothetical protein
MSGQALPRGDSELVEIARDVCFEQCRALICEQRGYCTNSYPGDGSGAWFHIHFPEALIYFVADMIHFIRLRE